MIYRVIKYYLYRWTQNKSGGTVIGTVNISVVKRTVSFNTDTF